MSNKVNLNTIGLVPEAELKYLQIGEATFEVKSRITYDEVLSFIQFVINHTFTDNGFISYPVLQIYTDLAFIKYYTNADLEEVSGVPSEQALYGFYDYVSAFEVHDKVKALIDNSQIKFIQETLNKTLLSIMEYRNSAKGLIDHIQEKNLANAADSTALLAQLEKEGNFEQIQKFMQLMEGKPLSE